MIQPECTHTVPDPLTNRAVNQVRARLGLGRVLAALLGAPVAAFAAGCAAMKLLPLAEQTAFAFGLHLMVPLWVTLVCALPLMKTGRAAWLLCGLVLLSSTLVTIGGQ